MQQVESSLEQPTIQKEAVVSHEYNDNDVAVANVKGEGNWKISRAGDFGWGIFALRDFAPDEFIFRGKSIAF